VDMAFYGGGYGGSYGSSYGGPFNGGVFGGYAGGFNQTPQGYFFPPSSNSFGGGYPSGLGSYLPSVDPNTYPGTVHFGPSTAVIGPSSVVPTAPSYGDPIFGGYNSWY